MGGKRRNKNKTDRDELAVTSAATSKKQTDTEMASDQSETESVATHVTLDDDMRSIIADEGEIDDVESEPDAVDFSQRMGEYLENATDKNVSIRMAALDNLKIILTKHYMADEIEKWKATIVDVIEKALRKTDEESLRAALLAALVSIQLGEEVNDQMDSVVEVMRDICADSSRSETLRVQCIHSTALCSFLSLIQPNSLTMSVNTLRSLWITTKMNTASPAVFSSAVAGWALLIHQAGRRALEAALLDQPKLCTFIDGTQVEMRVSTGEALAVLYEAAVIAMGESYRFPNHTHLLELLALLSTDSLKFRAKKDRRVQRFTFRQIYQTIKDQEAPYMKVKFGNETLELDSCGKKLLYDLACRVLHGGMNTQLKSNLLLRDLFDLGPVREDLPTKVSKLHRMAIQNAVNKSRELQRAKQRDKRAC